MKRSTSPSDVFGIEGILRMIEKYLTLLECATKLKLHVETVRRLISDGVLPVKKVGFRKWRIPANVLDALVTGGLQSDVNSKLKPSKGSEWITEN